MKIKSTRFLGLKVIQSKRFVDYRGFFKEDYKKKLLKKINFVFACTSSSKKNVIRGLHLQTKFAQEKYVSVLKCSIFDVVLDIRKKSKTYGKFKNFILHENNFNSLYFNNSFNYLPYINIYLGRFWFWN